MAELVQGYDHRKACCREPKNLVLVMEAPPPRPPGLSSNAPGLVAPKAETYQRCKVCGCRHFEMLAEPLEINFNGSDAT